MSSLVGPDGRDLTPAVRAKVRCAACGAPSSRIVTDAGFGGHVSTVCLDCGAELGEATPEVSE